jgi:CheY-like chemotaxis protein
MKKFNKILLVEDDIIDAYLSKMVIEQMQISEEIVICKDGQEALLAIDSYKEDATPDLILLDLKMPGMDGIEFLQELRKSFTQQFSIVILSSSNHPYDISMSGKYEACYYLVKPLTEDKIKKMVQRCFVK